MSSATSEIDIEALKRNLHERLETHKAPFHGVDHHAAAAAIDALRSNEPAHWAETWSRAALPFEEAAQRCEATGDRTGARDAYLNAYGLLHAGRFPSPTHPAKWACYLRSVRNFRAAGAYFDPPLEVITIPFAGRAGEGTQITFYIRRRAGTKQPVVIRWGGVDTWKEERTDYNEAMLAAGFASINIDMPGVGEAPVLGSVDAERQYGPLFDWIRTQPDLDAARVVVIGMSYGGYWATKIAHTYPDRVVAAVNWGGGIDRFFTREWNLRSASAPSYLMDLSLTRARTVGAATYDEYIERVRDFSLVAQGVLDRPHAPMLIVNGRDDQQVPFDDMLVLLEHGAPKAARFFPGGHMGYGPDTFPTVLAWVKQKAGLA
ncbi:MAG: alpha/beta fold hydrolase [Candidatus Lustribacter sp.]|jgi:pimeloyl-ACP methyl ester carboxylesterase